MMAVDHSATTSPNGNSKAMHAPLAALIGCSGTQARSALGQEEEDKHAAEHRELHEHLPYTNQQRTTRPRHSVQVYKACATKLDSPVQRNTRRVGCSPFSDDTGLPPPGTSTVTDTGADAIFLGDDSGEGRARFTRRLDNPVGDTYAVQAQAAT
jgi:hypothetical protein